MKTAHRIGKETGLKWEQIQGIITREKIVPAFKKGRYNYYDQYQEDYIHNILYYTCMLTELTIESKLNHVESKEEKYEQFREFKLKTYERK